MTRGEGGNVYLTGKWRASPLGSAPSLAWQTDSMMASQQLLLWSWGRASPLIWREQATLFWLRTMAWELDVAILIAAASHCNLPQCMLKVPAWRSQQDNIICKKQWNPWFPNRNTSSAWVLLEMMSSKIQNWWQRPALPARLHMHWEQLLLWAGNVDFSL